MKIWHALELEIARAAEAAVAAQLWNAGTTGLEISEDTPAVMTLRAYFDATPDVEKLRAEINRVLSQAALPETALRRLEALTIADQDWLAEWKKGYEPIALGDKLLITPSWKRAQVADTDRLIVEIDPGMAFGTGTHETTRGCLELLEKYWCGGSLLDVGTGTGILAIAASKLFPDARIVAIDVDPEAIAVAEENAEINKVAAQIEIEVNKLAAFHGQEFAVVLANLTADVIIPLAYDLLKVVAAQGVLIVSGILREQGEEVLLTLAAHGFAVIESKPDNEWISYALRSQKTLI